MGAPLLLPPPDTTSQASAEGPGLLKCNDMPPAYFPGTRCSVRRPGGRILYLTGLLIIDGFLFKTFPRSVNVATELILIVFLLLLYTARASSFDVKLEAGFLETLLVTNQ